MNNWEKLLGNDTRKNKEKLWKEFTVTTENYRVKLFLAEEFNRRIDIGGITIKDATRCYRERTQNNKEAILTDFLILDDLIVKNTIDELK